MIGVLWMWQMQAPDGVDFINASIRIESGDASVDIGNGRDNKDAAGGSITCSTTDGSAGIDGISTQESLRDNPIHQVRVTEGTEAYIETGKRIPYFVGATWIGPEVVGGGVEYKDAVTGFYMLPRIRGDNVILEVSPFKSSQSHTGGVNIDTQSASTTITGCVGKWLLIGGDNRGRTEVSLALSMCAFWCLIQDHSPLLTSS